MFSGKKLLACDQISTSNNYRLYKAQCTTFAMVIK